MRKKKFNIFNLVGDKAELKISTGVKEIHPVMECLAESLAYLDFIHFVRITSQDIKAYSEITDGRVKIPITKPGHPTATGVQLIIDHVFNVVQFYEITSSVQGYGGKMVDAVMKALPEDWEAAVVMDWSQGFWERMQEKHKNMYII
jgi:hypothetical protein